MTAGESDFFEDDEPVEELLAAFEAGPHLVTEPPTSAFLLVSRNEAVGGSGYTISPGQIRLGTRALVSADQ